MARLSNRLKAPANREPSGGGSRHAFYDWCNEVLAEADDRQGEAVISFAALRVFTARWILMPLIFLPPSKPRPKQVGAERHDRLSMMTALGSAVSPQARR